MDAYDRESAESERFNEATGMDCWSGAVPPLDDDVRMLRRIRVDEGATGQGDPSCTTLAVVVDVETTGLDRHRDSIIELAARQVRYDAEGVITHIGPCRSWLDDPGVALDPQITSLTGLSNTDLAGHTIDEAAAMDVIGSASVVIAHNAAFDRPFVEARLPGLRNKAWACSCTEINWQARGFEDGRRLGWLSVQAGWFFDPHRGSADVDAVIRMLQHRTGAGTPAMGELIQTASSPSWIIKAKGAPFAAKDDLKARRYRWDPGKKNWWTQVREHERGAEEEWLAECVYGGRVIPDTRGPELYPVDWYSRHG